jgi:hypothetical protein
VQGRLGASSAPFPHASHCGQKNPPLARLHRKDVAATSRYLSAIGGRNEISLSTAHLPRNPSKSAETAPKTAAPFFSGASSQPERYAAVHGSDHLASLCHRQQAMLFLTRPPKKQ